MTLLFNILYAAHANGTHHKLALRALEQLSGEGETAEMWRRLYLAHAARLMEGSKAPDKSFKDFANHVLHPGETPAGDWGGAPEKTAEWHGALVAALQAKKWGRAAYAAGVMGHYYTDVWMPFHTGSSEEETVLHRAAEWSASKSFEALWELGQADPRAEPAPGGRKGDPAEITRAAARASHAHYRDIIAHYDHALGAREPEAGFDAEGRAILGRLLARAASGVARLMDLAAEQAGVAPAKVSLTARAAVAGLQIPSKWVLRKISDANTRAEVAAIYAEFEATGRVEASLPREQRTVRAARAAEFERRNRETGEGNPRKAALKAAAAKAKPASGKRSADKPNGRTLDRGAPVEKAPSIGKKTAERLSALGVRTVGELADCEPELVAACLDDDRMPAETVAQWRDQARLLTKIRGLSQAQAVMLVAVDMRTVSDVARASAEGLRDALIEAAKDPGVNRALRNPKAPDLDKAASLVVAAQAAERAPAQTDAA